MLCLPLPRAAAPAPSPAAGIVRAGVAEGGTSPQGKVPSARVSCGAGSFGHPGRAPLGGGEEACSGVSGGPQGLAHTAPCLLFGGGDVFGDQPPPCPPQHRENLSFLV